MYLSGLGAGLEALNVASALGLFWSSLGPFLAIWLALLWVGESVGNSDIMGNSDVW